MDEFQKLKREIEEKSTEELESKLLGDAYKPDSSKANLAKNELARRKKIEEQEKYNKTLKLAEENVEATKKLVGVTRNLVFATWGVVTVTFFIFLISLFKE